jgi:THO complex subunit 4
MSARLDQSLDEIIKVQRQTSGARAGRRTRRGGAAGRPAAVAPASGVKKTPKQAKGAVKAIPTGPSGASGEGKILISGLPKDVNEAQIKVCYR